MTPRPKGAEITTMKDINNLWEFLAYLISYRMKELVILVFVISFLIYMATNVGLRDGKGSFWERLYWKPVNVNIEVKK